MKHASGKVDILRMRLRERALGRSHAFDLPPHIEDAKVVPTRKDLASKILFIVTSATAGGVIVWGAMWLALKPG